MRGGALPPALLLAALAFALAFAPRRGLLPALAAAIAGALAGSAVALPLSEDAVFLGAWASVIVTALAVHLPRGAPLPLAVALAINAGFWAGATVAIAGSPRDLGVAALATLLIVPARALAAGRAAIAVKVVASWLVAVALLAATLPIVPTPGYKADHME